MIQIITYNVEKYKNDFEKDYKISRFDEVQALDDFEICIIDITDSEIWQYDSDTPENVNCRKDLITLKEAVINSKKCKILIVFPQNLKFNYHKVWKYRNGGNYQVFDDSISLKDIKGNIVNIISKNLFDLSGLLELSFEKTKTQIDMLDIMADFNFTIINADEFEKITFSRNSNKITTIRKGRIVFTTLDLLSNIQYLDLFMNYYLKVNKKERIPEWIKEVKFYNDEQLMNNKNSNSQKIEELEKDNLKLDGLLSKNLEYKSILYSTGDELVKVIMEILDEILEYDSKDFIDENHEDFLIKKEEITFIGEIKGLSSAIQNKNVSQIEVHVQNYFDKLQEEGKEENVKGLLVINHQRTKPLEERQNVHQNQKDLAKKYGVLIIETTTLLKIYESYKFGNITKEECYKMFKEETGVLSFKV